MRNTLVRALLRFVVFAVADRELQIASSAATTKITSSFPIAAFIVTGLLLLASLPMFSQQSVSSPEVFHDIYHDTSAPAYAYPDAAPAALVQRVIRPLPVRQVPGPLPTGGDQAMQLFSLTNVAATIGKNFDGLSDSSNSSTGFLFVPSDSNIAVGATQVVETINITYRVINKSTGATVLSKTIGSLLTGMSGLCGQGATSSHFADPVVVYDKIAQRWVISIIAFNSSGSTGNECIAVSSTSDATGTYHRYAFTFGTNLFNDYPKLGVWPDAYYASYNMFGTSGFVGAKACAYKSSAMLAGTAATAVCFTKASTSGEFSFLPSDLDGATLPPAGEPNFFVDLFSTTTLHLYKFHVDFVTSSNSKFTGPVTITVPAFTPACSSSSTLTCIPQGGTTQQLQSLGDRLMFRLAYRNLGTHESLVVTHSVKTSTAASGVRWYEIRTPNSTPTLFQKGTFGGGSNSRWMASIAMDKTGDIAVGFSKSSSTTHPGIGFTGRVPVDPLGTLETAATIFTGAGSQTGVNRWGDYSSMVLDPSDDCTFWYVNQYIPSNGSFNFHTRLASLKFPGCV